MKVWTLVLLSSIAYADTAGLLAPTLHPIDTPAQPTSNSPTDLLQPTTVNPIANRPLNNAGIYSLGGQIFVDRVEKVNTVIVSSASVSTMNVTGLLTVPNGVNSTDAAAFGQVHLLQAVCAESNSLASTTSNTLAATNIKINSFRPKSPTSTVLLMATYVTQVNGATESVWTFEDNGTNIAPTAVLGLIDWIAADSGNSHTMTIIGSDVPGDLNLHNFVLYHRTSAGVTLESGFNGTSSYMCALEFQ